MTALEYIVYYALMAAGVVALWAVMRYRAFITPLKKNFQRMKWEDLGRVVVDGKRYRAAGCAHSDGKTLLLLVRQVVPKRREAVIAEYDPEGGGFSQAFAVPTEMLPISDMAVDEGSLYLAAHGARGLVRLDLNESRARNEAVIIDSISTGLKRIGGLSFVRFSGERLLAMSDNRGKRRTYLVDWKSALGSGDFFASVRASFRDTGHAKGLTWDDGRLYKVARATGRELVYRIDLEKAVRADSVTFGIEATFYAPTPRVGCVLAHGGRLLVGTGLTGRLFGARIPAID